MRYRRIFYTGFCRAICLLLIIQGQAYSQTETPSESPQAIFQKGLRENFVDDLTARPNVPIYRAELALLPGYGQAVLVGTLTIEYINNTPDTLKNLVLRLYPNYPTFGGKATVSHILVNNTPLIPVLDETETILTIPLPDSLWISPGEKITLQMDYSTLVFHNKELLYRLYSYLETELALPSSLPLLSVYDPDSGWWKGTDHPWGDAVYSEIANFDITLTAPEYLTLITSGTRIEEQEAKDGMITRRYVAPLMRDFAIMASPDYHTLSGQVEDINLDVHYLPGGGDEAEKILQWASDAVRTFTALFGDYPYTELDIVETHTSAGGIEYPGLIVLSEYYWRRTGIVWSQRLTVHEVAHQWWYGLVGNNQQQHPWVDESLTDYSVALYYGEIHNTYQDIIDTYTTIYTEYEASTSHNQPIGLPTIEYSTEDYLPLVYRKGVVFYDLLLKALTRPVFLDGLQNYFAEFRYGITTPNDLQRVLEETSGQDLNALFILWVGYTN